MPQEKLTNIRNTDNIKVQLLLDSDIGTSAFLDRLKAVTPALCFQFWGVWVASTGPKCVFTCKHLAFLEFVFNFEFPIGWTNIEILVTFCIFRGRYDQHMGWKGRGEGWVMPTENNDKETPFLYVHEQINLKTRKDKI